MNVPSLLGVVRRLVPLVPSGLTSLRTCISRGAHILCSQPRGNSLPGLSGVNVAHPPLLAASVPQYNAGCGFKSRVKLHLRCKDCYFYWREGRKFVLCKTHPRHKQVQRQQREYKTWILTHATQGKHRPW